MSNLVIHNPFYASIVDVLNNPENAQQAIICNIVREGIPLGNLLNLKWFGLNEEVQKISQRILQAIKDKHPVGYEKIRFLTGHLENPTPLTRLHYLMLRLFREGFLQDYPEPISRKQAAYLMKYANKKQWPEITSTQIRSLLEPIAKKNLKLPNAFLPINPLINTTCTIEEFMLFIDPADFSLPATYASYRKNDPDAKRCIEACIQSGSFLDQHFEGFTILHLAAMKGDLSIVSSVLSKGVTIDILTTESNEHLRNATPLHCVAATLKNSDATSNKLEKMFLFLLNKDAQTDALDDQKQTPFHFLFQSKYLTQEFIQELYDKNPPVTDKSPIEGKTPLHYLLVSYPSIDPMPWLRLYIQQGGDKSVRNDFFKHLSSRTDWTSKVIQEFSGLFDIDKENIETYPPRKKQRTDK